MSASERRIIHVGRDCQARLVPTGDLVTIPAGSFVTLTQNLGGSYTVIFNGNMARVDAENADALGFEPDVLTFEIPSDGQVDEDQLREALTTVYDPEIPVNIVDLGLIYSCTVDDDHKVTVIMTLTAPGCGMGPVLVDEVKRKLSMVPLVTDVSVDLTFDPPWSRDNMTEEAQLELGIF